MHFAYFESLNLQPGDKITIVNHAGTIRTGYYKGNYSRSSFCFDFLSSKSGSMIEEVDLKRVQILQRIEHATHVQ